MSKVFVGLGSNLGDSLALLQEALQQLRSHSSISDLIISRFYQTKPLSDIPQPDFINAVCRFKTLLDSFELLALLQSIEGALGKTAKPKNAPRLIDLDILFYGDLRIKTNDLEIPHPRWQERLFVLRPLADVTDDERVHDLLRGQFEAQEMPEEMPEEMPQELAI